MNSLLWLVLFHILLHCVINYQSIEAYSAFIRRFRRDWDTWLMLQGYFSLAVRLSASFWCAYFFHFCICQCYYMLIYYVFILLIFAKICYIANDCNWTQTQLLSLLTNTQPFSQTSEFAPALSKEFLDIQTTIEW